MRENKQAHCGRRSRHEPSAARPPGGLQQSRQQVAPSQSQAGGVSCKSKEGAQRKPQPAYVHDRPMMSWRNWKTSRANSARWVHTTACLHRDFCHFENRVDERRRIQETCRYHEGKCTGRLHKDGSALSHLLPVVFTILHSSCSRLYGLKRTRCLR